MDFETISRVLLAAVGFGLVIYGVSLLSHPAAWIVGGAVVLIAALPSPPPRGD